MPETIREPTLRELLRTGAATVLTAVGQTGGFRLSVGPAESAATLESSRGEARVFPNLTTMATYLQRLGVAAFAVDVTHFTPARVRAARPDRAAALQRTRTTPRQPDLLASHER